MNEDHQVIDFTTYRLTKRKVRAIFTANDNAGQLSRSISFLGRTTYGSILLLNKYGQIVQQGFEQTFFDNGGYRDIL